MFQAERKDEKMKEWLSGSLVYSLLYRIFELLKRFCGKIAGTVARLNKYSLVYRFYKFLVNDTGKGTNMEKSVFFKAAAWFGRLLKKTAASLNAFFRLQAESSIFWKLIRDIDRGFHENPYFSSGLLSAGFFTAYAGASMIRGKIGTAQAAIMVVLFTAAAILLLFREKIRDIIYASKSYKLIKMIIKAVSP